MCNRLIRMLLKKQMIVAPEVLAGVLLALGIPAGRGEEIRESLRNSRLRPYRQGIEPVIVAWEQREVKITFYVPVRLANKPVRLRIRFEDGRTQQLSSSVRALGTPEVEGERFAGKEFVLSRLPFGFHTLEISAVGDAAYRIFDFVCADEEFFRALYTSKNWGAFLPMYAAHSQESWGAGNFSDWERLSKWIGSQGGTVAATLPLLAAFLDYPVCEPSPYSPASRLFWNEFYLDVTREPEFSQCREAQALVRSKPFQTELRTFRRSELIDYQAQWVARRSVLELLADHFFSKTSSRRAEFNRFLRAHPEVKEYSSFRAVCEKLKT